MALEPLSSAMTYQVQPIQATQSSENVGNNNRPAAGNMEGTAQDEAAQAVDNKMVVVESSADAATDGGNGEGSGRNEGEASNEQIKQAVEELNKKMIGHSEALFGIHEDTNRLTIKIVDKTTKETIKEYPPEKTLDMIARIWDMAGILVDEKR